MKFLVTGDWHLDAFKSGKIDPNTDLDLRVKDFFDAVDRMIETAIKEKVDVFVMNGDLFKGRTSLHHIETLVAERFNKIASHMKLIINLGNHDYTPKQLSYGTHTYSVLEKLSGSRYEVHTDLTHLTFDDVDVVLYPYYDLKRVDFESNSKLLDWVQSKVNSFSLTKQCKLFIGHGTPKGTIINEDFFFDLDIIEEPVLPHSLLDQFDMALFSHIHRRHAITPKIFHIGSPERVDFSEAEDDKGFIIYDTVEKQMQWHSTLPRPMSDIKLNLLDLDEFSNPTEEILKHLNFPDLSDRLIKISVELSSSNYAQLDHFRLKQVLDKSFWYKGPIYSVPRVQQTRMKEITEQLNDSQALEKVLITHEDLTDSERKQILIRGKGILDD